MNKQQIREGLQSERLHPFPLLQHLTREGDDEGAPFVAEAGPRYVEGMPAAELAGRLGAVLSGGDRASIFCYLQAAERRVRGMEMAPAGVSETPAGMRSHLQGNGRRRKVEEARRRVEEAREVSGLVWAMRRGGRHAGDVHALQGYGDLSQRLAGIGR